MTPRRLGTCTAGVMLALVFAGCGRKTSPLPPLNIRPGAIDGLSVERDGSVVLLRFTVPSAGPNDESVSAADRVEVFAITSGASDPAPTPEQIVQPANLIATVAVRDPADPPANPPDARPAPGDIATVADRLPSAATSTNPAVRRYAAVAALGRRRGPASAVLALTLKPPPPPPTGVKAAHGETVLTLSWQLATATQFIVAETDASGSKSKRLTPAPLDLPQFAEPVQFGVPRCFVVRAVERQDVVSTLGVASDPVCLTAVDRFPPRVPTAFLAAPVDGGIELTWSAVAAPDLAGYIVLRGDGASGTLQPLMTTPVVETTYRDRTVKPGETYSYAMVAVDRTANRSSMSERKTATAR